MNFCPHCGDATDQGARFCTGCGKPLASSGRRRLTGWRLWLTWLLLTPLALLVALMVIGLIANTVEKHRYKEDLARREAATPIDADLVDGIDHMPLPDRPAYYLSQFALQVTSRVPLQPSNAAAGGSSTPAKGGPESYRP